MTEFVRLTRSGGKAVYVNLHLVEYITPENHGAMLTFARLRNLAKDILFVQETPDQIFAIAAATRG